ncbi:TPA: phage tail protein I [Vibrio cholerae]|nr:phage tail protein I [Vibrio cholerae]
MMRPFISKLPPSASKLERAMEQVFYEEIALIERDIKDFLDPYKCRSDLLPYLAWEMSVDYWDESWSDQTKRNVIASSIHIHTYKGTRDAIDKSIESIRADGLKAVEYFEDRQNLRPGFFRVDLIVKNSPVDEKTPIQIRKAVTSAKNTRSHLESITITAQSQCQVKHSVISRMGIVISSNPWVIKNIYSECGLRHCCFARFGIVIRSGPMRE